MGRSLVAIKNKFDRLLKKLAKITKSAKTTTYQLLDSSLLTKIKCIMGDVTHSLHKSITFSERSGRVHIVKMNREMYRHSFFPSAIKLHYNTIMQKI